MPTSVSDSVLAIDIDTTSGRIVRRMRLMKIVPAGAMKATSAAPRGESVAASARLARNPANQPGRTRAVRLT